MVRVPDELLNVRETAKLLGVHENTVRNWVREGLLPQARVPGSRFHRFWRSDVERLGDQRGQPAATLTAERRLIGPELIDGTQLDVWADTKQAQLQFPQLIRRLLAATPGVTGIVIRSGEGVAIGGWDGIADSEGSAYLPVGPLRFEFGVDQKIKQKADKEWAHRALEASLGDTFIFATPRRWGGAQRWAETRRAEHRFADVRVIDADVLEGWLQQTPAVHYWISELMGRRPGDARTIDSWWSTFSSKTEPGLPLDLFLAGRRQHAAQLASFIADQPGVFSVRAEWAEDVKGFIHAALNSDDAAHPQPVILVDQPAVWTRIVNESGHAVLVPTYANADVASAVSHGHHVILPIDQSVMLTNKSDIALPRLGRLEAADAFQAAGIEFGRAQKLAAGARRNLQAFVRSLSKDARFARPDWAQPPIAKTLAKLALIGNWTTAPADISLVESLASLPWHEIESLLIAASETTDPVFRRVGDQWNLTAPTEAFAVLAPMLSSRDVEQWTKAARTCLGEPNPVLDLPLDERPLAGIRKVRRQYSSAIRQGIARGAAIMGAHGDEIFIDGITALDHVASRVVREMLQQTVQDPTGRRWQELIDVLQLLAEAAPREFLDILNDDLAQPSPTVAQLFRASEKPELALGPTSPHPQLLWALEDLAWSPEYFLDAVRSFAKLASMDLDVESANTPLDSLSTVLCGWVRNTLATLDQRVQALEVIRREHPQVCWSLLLRLLPERQGFQIPSSLPRIRDWYPASRIMPMADWVSYTHAVVRLALSLTVNRPERLAKLVKVLNQLPTDDQAQILTALEQVTATAEALPFDQRFALWESVRQLIDRHRRYASADWALGAAILDRLEALATQLEPTDDPKRFAYLFAWRPDIPELVEHPRSDYMARAAELAELQRAAIAEVLTDEDPLRTLTALVDRAPVPRHVGFTLAKFDQVSADALLGWFGAERPALQEAAQAWLQHKLALDGPEVLRDLLARCELTGPGRELVIRCVPARAQFWDVLDLEQADAEIYWQTAHLQGTAAEDLETAVTRLVAHDRAWAAIEALADAVEVLEINQGPKQDVLGVAPSLVITTLERAISEDPRPHDVSDMTSYYVGALLDYLAARGTEAQTLARFEFAFFRVLEHTRPPKALAIALATQSDLFVDLSKRVYRGKHDAPRKATELEQRLANQAWWVLNGWHGFPGQREDGTLDANTMHSWVTSARFALSECDRADIGDELIGQAFAYSPVGSDGIWPAEPVRELIETIGSRELENGFIIGRLNTRGVTMRGPYDGGEQERQESARYKSWSDLVKLRCPRTARILRGIAESYERDARREDIRAELDADHD